MVRVLDADEYRFAQLLGKSATYTIRDAAEQTLAVAVPDLVKVGPHGYEHGWVFVGVPGVGARVFHPRHGHGEVRNVDEHGHVHVGFDNGKARTFEHAGGKGNGTLVRRGGHGNTEFGRHMQAATAANRRRDHATAADEYQRAADTTSHPQIAQEMRQRAATARAKSGVPESGASAHARLLAARQRGEDVKPLADQLSQDQVREAIRHSTALNDRSQAAADVHNALRASGRRRGFSTAAR